MDESIEPQVSMYNTIFVGGAILWTVLSSIVIYIQYSTMRAVSAEQKSKKVETSGGKKGSRSLEMKITFGTKAPSKSEY